MLMQLIFIILFLMCAFYIDWLQFTLKAYFLH